MLGLIGGSGLYDLPGLADTRWVDVDTPWGAPSDEVFVGRLGDARLAFLPRHGRRLARPCATRVCRTPRAGTYIAIEGPQLADHRSRCPRPGRVAAAGRDRRPRAAVKAEQD